MTLPLQGITVLDLSRALAGPFCSMILGDLGADVIKAEPLPKGEMSRAWGPFDGKTSVYYLSINRNKRSLALNFRDPDGLAVLRRLAGQVDVVVENFKPGTMAAMGLDYETLRAENPGLIFAAISAFGQDGPYGRYPGFDQIAQGMSGLMSITGHPETGPVRVGIPIGDVIAGMWLTMGILSAVVQRQRDGQGQRVDTSLLAGLVGLLNVQGQRYLSLEDVPGVPGNDHPVLCPYGTFEAGDGLINVAAATPAMWSKLCELIGAPELENHPDFVDNDTRLRNREALKRELNSRFAARGQSEWVRLLSEAGIPAGPIYTMDKVFNDPQVLFQQLVEETVHPALGPLKQMASPIRLSTREGQSVRTPPPLLGEHNAAVLGEFGWDAGEIQRLEAAGVLGGESPPAGQTRRQAQ